MALKERVAKDCDVQDGCCALYRQTATFSVSGEDPIFGSSGSSEGQLTASSLNEPFGAWNMKREKAKDSTEEEEI